MDPRGAPQWVGQAHVADQLADFERHLRSAAATRYIARTNNSLRHHALSGGRSIHTLAVG